jgi:hypothetical protein
LAFPTKIVTCCYCGARAALVLSKQGQHELACSRCAAPLHDMKMLRVAKKAGAGELIRSIPAKSAKPSEPRKFKKSSTKRKKSKRLFKFFKDKLEDTFEDAFDLIEDIFD